MYKRQVKGEIQIASREEVKEACRAVIVDSANWYNVNIDRNTSRLYYTTGKYGIVPVVPTSCLLYTSIRKNGRGWRRTRA